MNEMIAYCGLNCTKCDAYLATVNNDNALREKTAKLWSELNNAPILPEMINCMGCCADGVKTPYCDSMCGIRHCAMKKTLNSCAHCTDMDGCEELKSVLDNSEEARVNITNLRGD